MTVTNSLWNLITIGQIQLEHRLAMAPMTHSRSTPEGVPGEINAEYYAQRASTALITTEGTQPPDDGQGYLLTPGIYTDEHIAGWQGVTDTVHGAGGRIVVQLMHTGRISHPSNTPHGRQPVALLLNRGGASLGRRVRDIEDDLTDIVMVGALVLANPDLVARVKSGAPLNGPDPSTFYGGDERDYTDYPTLRDTITADVRVA